MEKILILLLVIGVFVIFYQRNSLIKMRKKCSLDKIWYSNNIHRDLKESFINKLESLFKEKNLDIKEVLEYYNQDDYELENLVEYLLEKTSIAKLYLPKEVEEPIVIDGLTYYPYRIGKYLKLSSLLHALPSPITEYVYSLDLEKDTDSIKKVLDSNEKYRDRNFARRYCFFVKKDKDILFVDASLFRASDPEEWWVHGSLLDKEHTVNLSLDKEYIIFLPKKIKFQ